MTTISFFTTMILTLILVISVHDFYSLFFGDHNVISKKCLFFSILLCFSTSVAMNMYGTSEEFNIIVNYMLLFVIALNYKAHIISKLFGGLGSQ